MARPTKYVTRSDLGWPSTSGGNSADPRGGLVVHYDSSNQSLASKPHSECIAYWQWCRRFHTGPSRGWADVGYSYFACAHGYVMEGRGPRREQAAQPGGNRTHYSVTLATGPTDTITEDQINAVRELRLHLMDDYRNAGTVLGHRDFTATSCPGDRAYALVTSGTFSQPPGAITEGADLLGLKEGDGIPTPSEGVKAVQRLIVAAGFGSELDPYGVDGQWGENTSTGLLKARQYVGSNLTSIKTMTGESYAQLIRACARREAERAAGRIEIPECECTGGGGSLPTEETVTITGTLERN